jgi:hypothetical protein
MIKYSCNIYQIEAVRNIQIANNNDDICSIMQHEESDEMIKCLFRITIFCPPFRLSFKHLSA